MEQLQGRVAVITGGGSGIGEGLAHACHAAGMKVVVSDIEQGEAERVANAVRELGGEAIAVRADVSSRESVDALAAQAYEAFGAVHLVCSNAGVMMVAPLLDTAESDWDWTLGVNLHGAVHCARAFVPRMREQGGEAHLVFTASVAGTYAIRELPLGTYTSSKYAVVGFSEVLREELAADGIGVSVLCPGGVETRIFDATRNRPEELGGHAPPPPEADERMAEREEQAAAATLMPPREVGERVLEGVRADRLFIFTHPDQRAGVEARYEQMMADYDAIS